MPYGREEGPGGKSHDRPPPWWNPDEIKAAVRTLELLRANKADTSPSLAVLSPYAQQVEKLRTAISRKMDGSLSHLRAFNPAINPTDYCGTVDSFQGGEADLVIVSMVRNNAHASPKKALGFLRDNRRMNVLLSRAKWRLILIGSLSFYRHVVEISRKLPDQDVYFIAKFLEALKETVEAKEGQIVSFSDLSGSKL